MLGKRKREIAEISARVWDLKVRICMLENPAKYKYGDKINNLIICRTTYLLGIWEYDVINIETGEKRKCPEFELDKIKARTK